MLICNKSVSDGNLAVAHDVGQRSKKREQNREGFNEYKTRVIDLKNKLQIIIFLDFQNHLYKLIQMLIISTVQSSLVSSCLIIVLSI